MDRYLFDLINNSDSNSDWSNYWGVRKSPQWKMLETGTYRCSVVTAGILPDDIKVEIRNTSVVVSGSSEHEGEKYSIQNDILMTSDMLDNLSKLEYTTLNGITYIYAYTRKPEIHKVVPKRI